MKFKKYLFEDIVNESDGFLRGPFGSDLKKSLFVEKGKDTYKVYEQGVVLENNKNVGKYYISKEYFDNKMEKFEVKTGDFLVSCSGVNYGAIIQLSGDIEQGIINQALLRIRINKDIVDDNFFLYYFKSYIARVITKGTGDSTIPNFPAMSVIKKIEVSLPNIDTQRKIGLALKNIDLKIKNNNDINNELENMAYNLYLHTFFKKEKNGELESIIIENPKSSVQVGQAKDKKGNYPFFTSGDSILEWDNVMIKGRNLYLNTGGNADVKFYVGEAAYSTDTWCITAKDNMEDYLYLMLKSIKDELNKKFFQGSGLKHLQKPLLKKEKLYIPTKEEIEFFNNKVQPMFSIISKNAIENKELLKISQFLLPLLITGQINVDKLDLKDIY